MVYSAKKKTQAKVIPLSDFLLSNELQCVHLRVIHDSIIENNLCATVCYHQKRQASSFGRQIWKARVAELLVHSVLFVQDLEKMNLRCWRRALSR